MPRMELLGLAVYKPIHCAHFMNSSSRCVLAVDLAIQWVPVVVPMWTRQSAFTMRSRDLFKAETFWSFSHAAAISSLQGLVAAVWLSLYKNQSQPRYPAACS